MMDRIVEDKTLYHGTRADFSQFDLAYLSSGWGQQDWGYGVYLTDYPECAKEYGRGGMIYTVQVPNGKYLNDKRISPTEANNIAKNFFNYYLNTDYGKSAYGDCRNEFWEYECKYIAQCNDGLNLYGSISSILGSDKEASEYLDSIGYVGLIYAGENRDTGDKFKNYVIFNPNKIKIAKKEVIQ